MTTGENFISQYLSYVGDTEAPVFYHRWCCMSMVGAYLGRQYKFKFGHFDINSNMYVMLIGTPGVRKSTSIKLAKKLLVTAGYNTISADKSSKEKFIDDLASNAFGGDEADSAAALLNQNLWGDLEASESTEMFIACDEFNDFIGNGNVDFISLLGTLWDYNGVFKNRIKSGKSVNINNPTINILGGNTPVNFARAFPPEILGQGFFSRLLLIHGESTGKRITFPKLPSAESTVKLVEALQRVKQCALGIAEPTPEAEALLDKIYQTWQGMDDIRFEHYANRRFDHLLKLCLVISASHYTGIIKPEHVVQANTILTHTEAFMPKAIGEFGKSKNSDITHKIMQIINSSMSVVTIKDLWESLHNDMEKFGDLGEMLRNLTAADKILSINGGFLPNKRVIEEVNNDLLDYSYLTKEEREMSL